MMVMMTSQISQNATTFFNGKKITTTTMDTGYRFLRIRIRYDSLYWLHHQCTWFLFSFSFSFFFLARNWFLCWLIHTHTHIHGSIKQYDTYTNNKKLLIKFSRVPFLFSFLFFRCRCCCNNNGNCIYTHTHTHTYILTPEIKKMMMMKR